MQQNDQTFVCDKRDCNITCVIYHGLLQSCGVLQKDLYNLYKLTVSIVSICKVDLSLVLIITSYKRQPKDHISDLKLYPVSCILSGDM